jgi:diguanylate cyclase (GGDEF)-like protein/PAS domain S-box-containing protein
MVLLASPIDNQKKARTIACMLDGEFIENFEYSLKDTPCENTVTGTVCTYEQNIAKLFPKDYLLIEMKAESYLGVPFFDNHGNVNCILVVVNRTSITNKQQILDTVRKYQAMITHRLKLLDVEHFFNSNTSSDKYANDFFNDIKLGVVPNSNNLTDWLNISSQALNRAKEGLIITDAKSRIISVNQAFTKITGFTFDEALGQTPAFLASGEHSSDFYHTMYLSLEKNGFWEGEIINRNKNGETYPEWLDIRAIYNDFGKLSYYMGIFSDISEHKENEELLYFQANYDALTMLANRSQLFNYLATSFVDSNQPLHLVHVDLNGLVRINENYGYHVGDAVIIEVANRLKAFAKEADLASRISGDNFVLALKGQYSEQQMTMLAENILEKVAEPIIVDEYKIKLDSNLGIAQSTEDSIPAEDFFNMAEQALLEAKVNGRNKYAFYDKKLHEHLRYTWTLQQELMEAIELDQLELYFQPQINSQTGLQVGAEVLVRWLHPSHGILQPGEFIPLAEKANLIVPLGNLILEKACRQIKHWSDSFGYNIRTSINISPRQFALEAQHHTIKQIIKDSGVDKKLISLEITEDVLMSNQSEILQTLNELKAFGLHLSLDDFGTGFSSLAYLQSYPLDELKIDRSFVRELDQKAEAKTIVKTIISMAKALQLKVVAEGVETEQQRNILSMLECDILQGFYYSKPVPIAEYLNYFNATDNTFNLNTFVSNT